MPGQRDDSMLYSGATSASFSSPKAEELKAKQAEAKQGRLDVHQKLKPAAEVVLGLIDKHRNKFKYIGEFEDASFLSDETFRAEMMARKKFYGFLNQFEQEIKIALKDVSE